MVRIDDSGEVAKCWLNQDELTELERVAHDRWGWEREIAMQLMGRCGLRASEVGYPGEAELKYSEEGDCYLFEIRGKNTKGGDPKIRDAWMPDGVADDLRKFSRERGLRTGEPWVDTSTPTVRRWVKQAVNVIAEERESDRWRAVSSHDLRRSWATHHLVERQVDVRTMMSIGGWSDYSAIEPYLAEPTEKRIGEAMAGVN